MSATFESSLNPWSRLLHPERLQGARLLLLANVLRTKVPTKKFNMDRFGDTHSCDSDACALGWATTIPSFNKAGFVASSMHDACPQLVDKLGNVVRDDGYAVQGISAACLFFGMSWREANNLFGQQSPSGRTPKQVARRIEQFVIRKRKTEQKAKQ